jgi:hypothetical protein
MIRNTDSEKQNEKYADLAKNFPRYLKFVINL